MHSLMRYLNRLTLPLHIRPLRKAISAGAVRLLSEHSRASSFVASTLAGTWNNQHAHTPGLRTVWQLVRHLVLLNSFTTQQF